MQGGWFGGIPGHINQVPALLLQALNVRWYRQNSWEEVLGATDGAGVATVTWPSECEPVESLALQVQQNALAGGLPGAGWHRLIFHIGIFEANCTIVVCTLQRERYSRQGEKRSYLYVGFFF